MRVLPRLARTSTAVFALALLPGRAVPDEGTHTRSVESLISEYKRLEKSHDGAECTARRRVVERLAEASGDEALRHLRRILRDDSAVLVRMAAIEGLCLTGGTEDLSLALKALKKESQRYEWIPLWVARTLARARHPEARGWIASQIPKHGTGEVALGLVRAAGGLRSAEAVEPLVTALEEHGGRRNGRFSFEVLRALARIGGSVAHSRLLEAAADPDPQARIAAADSCLAASAEPVHVECVSRLFADADPWVRRAAARGVGGHKAVAHRDHLVAQLGDRSRLAAHAARQALIALEGVDRGPRPEAWSSQGGTYAAPSSPTDERRTKLPTDRVLFMIDMSISMGWPALTGVPRLPTAKRLVNDLIARLDEGSHFNVREFASESTYWKKPAKRGPAEFPATPKNVEEATRWVDGLKAHMFTNFGEIAEALDQHPSIDTIHLVTDGRIQFDADDTLERILVRLESANLVRQVPIHVTFVWWGPSQRPEWELTPADHRPLLEGIARESGGTYREILEPPP